MLRAYRQAARLCLFKLDQPLLEGRLADVHNGHNVLLGALEPMDVSSNEQSRSADPAGPPPSLR